MLKIKTDTDRPPYASDPAGLYIHIPFCKKKCPYCDFYSITDRSLISSFSEALFKEMDMVCQGPLFFDTLYLGGGTPSVLEGKMIHQIIEKARDRFKILPDSEITIEINPGTVTFDRLKVYYDSSINRVNVGVQSFFQSNLDFLNRIHMASDSIFVLEALKKVGFRNIGLDLIYGIPGQTAGSWVADLQKALESEPEHLSCYMLTYESKTPMNRDRKKKKFAALAENRVADLFETTVAFLESHGYRQYEISNFAKTGFNGSDSKRSKHNQKYWSGVPYIGLGPSAHSFIGSQRYWNHRSVRQYAKDVNKGKRPIAGAEALTRNQRMIETLYLGFRKRDGIDIGKFNERFEICFEQVFRGLIADLKEKGLIEIDRNRCALSQKGMLLLDRIAEMFISHPAIG